MSGNPHLNGSDYLMLGFDYELRRRGFAGYSCQILLELKSTISASKLQERLRSLTLKNPMLNASPRGLLLPKWKLPRQPQEPRVRIHRDEPGRCGAIINEPLAARIGELARFDLIYLPGRTRSWTPSPRKIFSRWLVIRKWQSRLRNRQLQLAQK
jgi:hypothetical protein